MENIYDRLDQIPEKVIKNYLYGAAHIIQLQNSYYVHDVIDWIEHKQHYKKIMEDASNNLMQEIQSREIEIGPRDLSEYLLKRAISYYNDFRNNGLFMVTQRELNSLLEKILIGQFQLEIQRNSV